MAIFEYKGVGPGGKQTKGTIDSDSSKSARQKLKGRGIFVSEIKERTAEKKGKQNVFKIGGNVSQKSVTMMTRQLATMVKARIPLDEALDALVEQSEDPKLKSVMSQVKVSVNEGRSLAESCKMFPKVFPPIFTSMIKVGETAGNLDVVLLRLASFAESSLALKNKVKGAMAYPLFMMVAGTGIIIFLFAFAVPKITEVFQGSDMPMPTLTVVMISISDFLAKYWWVVVAGIFGSFFLFKAYTSTQKGRDQWDAVTLKVPLFGKLSRMIAVSRFARTLSTMLGSGVQLLDAIDIVKDVVDNAVIRDALIHCKESISEGHSIAGPLKASGEFPPILTHMIAVGEKTGELEQMLNVVADSYDEQVDTAIQSMTRLLEPLMIAVMGGIVGLVAVSIFLPLLEMNSLATTP